MELRAMALEAGCQVRKGPGPWWPGTLSLWPTERAPLAGAAVRSQDRRVCERSSAARVVPVHGGAGRASA